jgi:VanZ family protein
VTRLIGTHNWKNHAAVFQVPAGSHSARLVLNNFGKSGNLWVDNLSLATVAENPTLPIWKTIIALVFAITFTGYLLFFGHTLMASKSVIFIATLILLGASIPNNYLKDKIVTISHWSKQHTAPQTTLLKTQEEKQNRLRAATYTRTAKHTGHIGLFFFLSAIVTKRITRKISTDAAQQQSTSLITSPAVTAFLAIILFAAATETLQYFSPSRTPQVSDLGLDVAGIITGILVGTLFPRLKSWGDYLGHSN